MPQTYDSIASTTLSSPSSSVTLSSIPSTFTDLVLIINAKSSSGDFYPRMTLGSASLSRQYLIANAIGTAGANLSQDDYIVGENLVYASGFLATFVMHFMDYSNTTTFKPIIVRSNNPSRGTELLLCGCLSTSAINSIVIYGGSFDTGTTFSLYGIKAA